MGQLRSWGRSTRSTSMCTALAMRGASLARMRRRRLTNSAMEWQIAERRCASRAQPRPMVAATLRTDAQPPTWIHMLSQPRYSRQRALNELDAVGLGVERLQWRHRFAQAELNLPPGRA